MGKNCDRDQENLPPAEYRSGLHHGSFLAACQAQLAERAAAVALAARIVLSLQYYGAKFIPS
jgi:hypothetical protein